MQRTNEVLGKLLNYQRLSAIRFLELPKIEKQMIQEFISCPNFEKAMNKIDQKMERANQKVERLAADIEEQNKIIKKANYETRHILGFDNTNANAVAKHNDWVERGRKANDKRNDLVDKHNEAIEEAKEELHELQEKALLDIDQDIENVFIKCTPIVTKLSGSQNTEDLVAAIEICLIELKIFALFEDKIDSNTAQKNCHDQITEVNKSFTVLCSNEHVRNYLSDLFRKNGHLLQKNAESYAQIVKVLGSVDQSQLDALTQSVTAVLGENFNTNFEYNGVVDPVKLDAIIVKIKDTITAINNCIAKAKEVAASIAPVAQTAVSAGQNAQMILGSMKSSVEQMRNDILDRDHFACEMIDEAVIDDIYHKDLRPAVTGLRQHLVGAVGEEYVDSIIMKDDDRYLLGKAENAIKQANLTRLKTELDKVNGYVKGLSGLISNAKADIAKAGKVPQENADAMRTEMTTKYALTCIPVIGFIFAILLLGRLKAFEPGFRSKTKIYRDLGAEILAKNGKMTTVVMVLGGLLGLGGTVAFFALRLGPISYVTILGATLASYITGPISYVAIPGAILASYVITIALLVTAGKRLRDYLGL